MTDEPGWSLIFEGLERVSNELDEAWTVVSDQPLLDRARYSLSEAIRRAFAARSGPLDQGELPRAVVVGTAATVSMGRFHLHLRPGARGLGKYELVIRETDGAAPELAIETGPVDRRALIRLLSVVTPRAVDETPRPG